MKKGVNTKWYSHQKYGFSIIEQIQPKDVKPKMEHQLRSLNWQGVLKQRGVKQRPSVYTFESAWYVFVNVTY
jgi:hypothetical protein